MLFTFVGKFFLFFSSFFDEKGKTRKNLRTGKQNGLKFLIFQLNRTKSQLKKSFHVWLLELFLRAVFFSSKNPFYDFLAGNNYPDSPHLPHKFHLYLIFRLVCFGEYPNIYYRVVHYIGTETKIISLSDNQFKRKKVVSMLYVVFKKVLSLFVFFEAKNKTKEEVFSSFLRKWAEFFCIFFTTILFVNLKSNYSLFPWWSSK